MDVVKIRTALLSGSRSRAAFRLACGAGLAALLLVASGCSTSDGEEGAAEYPNLATVPEKPETIATLEEADKIGEGLRADRENARYTDESLRADTSVQPPLVPPRAPETEVRESVSVSETVEMTASGTTVVVEERVETQIEEKAEPSVAAVPQEQVEEARLSAPAAEAASGETAADVGSSTTVVSSRGVERDPIASVYERQLAASAARRLPDGVQAGAGSSSVASAAATSRPRPQVQDSGRLIPNYAAADGRTPVETLYFAQGSSRLSAEDRAKLDRIARSQKAAGTTIRIVGHASSRTRDMPEAEHMMVNFNVSQQRAAAVAAYLLNAGVAADKLRVESVSDREPATAEAMPRAEAMNRRVEIFILN